MQPSVLVYFHREIVQEERRVDHLRRVFPNGGCRAIVSKSEDVDVDAEIAIGLAGSDVVGAHGRAGKEVTNTGNEIVGGRVNGEALGNGARWWYCVRRVVRERAW